MNNLAKLYNYLLKYVTINYIYVNKTTLKISPFYNIMYTKLLVHSYR